MTLEEYRQMISHRSINDSIIEEVVGVMTIKTSKKVTAKGFKQETQQEEEWVRLPVGDIGRKYWLSKSGEVKRDTGKNSKGRNLGYSRLMQKPNKQGCIVITSGSNRLHINVKKIHEEYWPENNNNNKKTIKIKINKEA